MVAPRVGDPPRDRLFVRTQVAGDVGYGLAGRLELARLLSAFEMEPVPAALRAGQAARTILTWRDLKPTAADLATPRGCGVLNCEGKL
jgi:hypothetical protein